MAANNDGYLVRFHPTSAEWLAYSGSFSTQTVTALVAKGFMKFVEFTATKKGRYPTKARVSQQGSKE